MFYTWVLKIVTHMYAKNHAWKLLLYSILLSICFVRAVKPLDSTSFIWTLLLVTVLYLQFRIPEVLAEIIVWQANQWTKVSMWSVESLLHHVKLCTWLYLLSYIKLYISKTKKNAYGCLYKGCSVCWYQRFFITVPHYFAVTR